MLKRILTFTAAIAVLASIALVAFQVGAFSSAPEISQKAEKRVTKPALPRPPALDTFPIAYRAQAEQAVFKVQPYFDRLGQVSGGGTGFLVEGADGQKVILTNHHVCEMNTVADWYVVSQGEQVFAAKLISMSKLADLCTLSVPKAIADTRRPYQLSPTKPRTGDLLAVFGHPWLRPLSIAWGQFINETREPISMLIAGFGYGDVVSIGRTDIQIYPGNSGSPIVDRTGQVVGIMFAYEGPGKAGLFVPTSDIKHFLETRE